MSSSLRLATPAPKQDRPLRDLLSADHTKLERLFDQLVEAFRAGAAEDAARLFTRFDEGLQEHLAFEERHILPLFAETAPEEAAALRSEHDAIRARLTALCVGVDLHLARADAVEAFVKALRAHARREDTLMYRWMSGRPPEPAQGELRKHWLEVARRLDRR